MAGRLAFGVDTVRPGGSERSATEAVNLSQTIKAAATAKEGLSGPPRLDHADETTEKSSFVRDLVPLGKTGIRAYRLALRREEFYLKRSSGPHAA